ncbi:MAG TPA: Spy/CpxP family protein refolding chaperone [Roseiarcus sp.]|nr:Spy/CpxP family protein refolding chaperone [Roseiarcus sp.]
MFRHLFPPLAVAIALAAGTAMAEQSAGPVGLDRMQNWAADHEALLNAKLGGLKAGLNLTPEQEKYWGPFENAVREAEKLHMQHMLARTERMRERVEGAQGGPGAQTPSPVDRLDAWAMGLAEDAAALKNIADAARPLYDGLNDQQKRIFAWLGRELLMMGHGHRGMGMLGYRHMGMMEGDRNEMGLAGPQGRDHMDMMGPGPGGMGPMQDGADEESNSDEE